MRLEKGDADWRRRMLTGEGERWKKKGEERQEIREGGCRLEKESDGRRREKRDRRPEKGGADGEVGKRVRRENGERKQDARWRRRQMG